jgi:hypothetical protein
LPGDEEEAMETDPGRARKASAYDQKDFGHASDPGLQLIVPNQTLFIYIKIKKHQKFPFFIGTFPWYFLPRRRSGITRRKNPEWRVNL